jgi:hypothetical protein
MHLQRRYVSNIEKFNAIKKNFALLEYFRNKPDYLHRTLPGFIVEQIGFA